MQFDNQKQLAQEYLEYEHTHLWICWEHKSVNSKFSTSSNTEKAISKHEFLPGIHSFELGKASTPHLLWSFLCGVVFMFSLCLCGSPPGARHQKHVR